MAMRVIEDQIIVSLRRIVRAIDQHSCELSQGHGLTGPQLAVLQKMEQEEAVSVGALAKAVYLGAPTVSGVLDRLEKQGLATRCRSESDRRQVMASITDAGRSMLEENPSLLQDRFRKQLAELQEWERLMILASLERVVGMMECTPTLPETNGDGADGDER